MICANAIFVRMYPNPVDRLRGISQFHIFTLHFSTARWKCFPLFVANTKPYTLFLGTHTHPISRTQFGWFVSVRASASASASTRTSVGYAKYSSNNCIHSWICGHINHTHEETKTERQKDEKNHRNFEFPLVVFRSNFSFLVYNNSDLFVRDKNVYVFMDCSTMFVQSSFFQKLNAWVCARGV